MGRFDPIRIVRYLLGLSALIWAVFAFFTRYNLAEQYPEQGAPYDLIALMMVGNATAMLVAAWLVGKGKRLFYLLTLALMLVNIFLTFTDQFGGFDLATLILDLIICGVLILRRDAFLPGRAFPSG